MVKVRKDGGEKIDMQLCIHRSACAKGKAGGPDGMVRITSEPESVNNTSRHIAESSYRMDNGANPIGSYQQ